MSTPAERTGDFSDLGFQLTNPVTGGPFKCGAHDCNQVPVDTVMQNYIDKYLPLPNLGTNGFVEDPVASLQEDQFIFRFDYNLTSKDLLSAFYIFDDQPQVFPFEVERAPPPAEMSRSDRGSEQPALPDRIAELDSNPLSYYVERAPLLGQSRRHIRRDSQDTTSPSDLGFLTIYPDDPKGTAPPAISVAGAFNLGPSPQGPTKVHDVTFQVQDTFSWTRGKHALKFGADFRWTQNNFHYDFYNNGSFDFGSYYPNTGDPRADFVGGFTDNYFQFSSAAYGIRTHDLYFFAQDAWKITKNLSLDYGLRYE